MSAPVAVSEAEILEAARLFEKVSVQEVRFPLASLGNSAEVSEEEVKSFYEQNGAA